MVLAEKIIALRKKNGWSQEELAEQLSVSRQAVSKWESEASIPDLDKILKMSQLFGVSTDYLLKEELEEPVFEPKTETESDGSSHSVSLELAHEFLNVKKESARFIAPAVGALILSPIPLLTLGAIGEFFGMPDTFFAGTGVVLLLLIVAISVAVLIIKGMQLERYEYLEKKPLALQYGVESLVRKRQQESEAGRRFGIAAGVFLCIISPIPLLFAGALNLPDILCVMGLDFLLLMVAIAVIVFIRCSSLTNACKILLQEGDYTLERKKRQKLNGIIATIYWCIVTALFLGISFSHNSWEKSWLIWPCAGVLFGAVCAIMNLLPVKGKQQ